MEEKMERVFLFVVLPFHWLGLTSLDFWETLSYTYFIPFMKLEVFFFFFFPKRSLSSIQVPPHLPNTHCPFQTPECLSPRA